MDVWTPGARPWLLVTFALSCGACKASDTPAEPGKQQLAAAGSGTPVASALASAGLPQGDVVSIVQSRSIGLIELHMPLDRLRALPVQWDVEAAATPEAPSIYRSGPWYVVVERGRVTSIELELRPGVQAAVGSQQIPAGASLDAVAALFTDCKPVEHAEGGDQIECDKRRTTVKLGPPGAPVAVQLLSEEVIRAIYGGSP